jgi:hypothetical protein
MSDPTRKSQVLKIAGRELTVKELTIGQIRERLEHWQSGAPMSVIDMLFPERLPSDVVAAAVGVSVGELDELDLSPSEMAALLDAVEQTNPTFASLVERLAKAGRAQAGLSTGPSAP